MKKVIALALGISAAAFAQQTMPTSAPVAVNFSAQTMAGEKIAIPAADAVSVMLFARPDQPQSRMAARQLLETIQAAGRVQSVLVFSGLKDQAAAQKLAQQMQWTGPVVLDPDYAASGQMAIHVWPTTVIVNSAGQQVAHLAGISQNYGKELDAYLAFAAGKIDQAALGKKLVSENVIADSNEQMASRHLQVAQKLLAVGDVAGARSEVEQGLKREPESTPLKVAMARVLLAQGDDKAAGALIDAIPKNSVPGWQIALLRGKLLLLQKQTDAAIPQLNESLKLNPDPAESFYELGRAYEAKGDFHQAADSYKNAFEATPAARGVVSPAR